MFNRKIEGWIGYFRCFYKSAVYPTLRLIDAHLVRWVMRKYKRFKQQPRQARPWRIASLIETCKLNGTEPHGYLSGVLTAIVNGHKQSDIDALLSWNYKGDKNKGNSHEHHRNQGHA